MQRFILRRLIQSVVVLFILSTAVFFVSRVVGGDPVLLLLPLDARAEDVAQARHSLGLDQPLPVQYWLFLTNAVRGDFGVSIKTRQSVMKHIEARLPNSVKLAAVSLAITCLLAFPLGVAAAVRRGTLVDTLARLVAVLGQSLPMFWVGLILIEIFAVRLRLLPASGMGGIEHYVLPAFTLGWYVVAGIMRLLRSSMLQVLDSDFVMMARMKGVPERVVIWKHALRNALIPVITFGALYFAMLITGAIIVETVFAWPGIGGLIYESVMYRDYPVIQGVVLLAAAIIVTINLAVDIAYAYLDPRIRYQ